MNAVTAQFITKTDDTGIKTFKKGFSDITSETKKLNSALDNSGANFDRLSRSAAKPMGAMVFRQMAMEALSSTAAVSKLEGATGMLSIGLRAVGSAAMLATGPIGAVAIVAAGAYYIFDKLTKSSKESAEAIGKNAEANYNEANQARTAAEAIDKTIGLSKEAKASLYALAEAKDNDLKKTQKAIAAELDSNVRLEKALQIRKQQAQFDLDMAKRREDYKSSEQRDSAIYEAKNRLMIVERDLRIATDEKTESEKKANAIGAISVKQLETQKQKMKEVAKSAQDLAEIRKQAVMKTYAVESVYMSKISDMFIAENGKVLLNSRSFFSQEVQAFGSMIAAKLEMKAAEYLVLHQYARAAFAMAEAGVVRGLASGASALIMSGGQSAGEGGVAGSSGSYGTEAASTTESGQSKSSSLTVNVTSNGGWTKQNAIDIAKLISEAVQTNNVTLVSSDLRLKSGVLPV